MILKTVPQSSSLPTPNVVPDESQPATPTGCLEDLPLPSWRERQKGDHEARLTL